MGVQGLWGMVLFGAFGVFFYQDTVVIDLQIVYMIKFEEKKLFMSVIQNHRDYLSEHRGNSCQQTVQRGSLKHLYG